jgi:SAM-dependent methyltransferase
MTSLYRFFLKLALQLHTFLYKVISVLAIKTEGGTHPKHRLMRYHHFFTSNISPSDRVLDIGCGNGELAFDVSKSATSVTAIDIDPGKIAVATKQYVGPNITYRVADATKDLGGETFDVVILSNVLEHIEHRVEFLRSIKPVAKKFLIRVPMFDRDWIPLYKKELGLEWRLDLTHYTEFTKETFYRECEEAGYHIESFSVQFGEVWAVVV